MRNRSRRAPTPVAQIGQQCPPTHQNGTPFKKPANNGGSPMGVRQPPTLATMKMKKTTWCAVTRYLFKRSQGRMRSIEAPVVPSRLARSEEHMSELQPPYA